MPCLDMAFSPGDCELRPSFVNQNHFKIAELSNVRFSINTDVPEVFTVNLTDINGLSLLGSWKRPGL